MESFLIEWPPEEKWFVSHSRLEADGKIMVFEFLKEGETKESWQELASTTTHIGVKVEKPASIWHNLITESRKNFPHAEIHLLDEAPEAEFPWGIYAVEEVKQPSICLIIQGQEAIYMNVVVFANSQIEPKIKEKWVQRFKHGKVVPQGIQDTLRQSNLAHLHLPNPSKPQPISKKIPPQAPSVSVSATPEWLNQPPISTLSHPQKPGDLPIFFEEGGKLIPVWVNIFDQKDHVYRGSVLSGQDHIEKYPAYGVLFIQYAASIGKMIQVSPAYLAEIPDWSITPCQPCGLDMLTQTPSAYIEEGQLSFEIRCPNCGGKVVAKHKHYVEPVTELAFSEAAEEIKIPWWKFWLARKKV